MKAKELELRLFGVSVITFTRSVKITRNVPTHATLSRDSRGLWVAKRIVEKARNGNPFAEVR